MGLRSALFSLNWHSLLGRTEEGGGGHGALRTTCVCKCMEVGVASSVKTCVKTEVQWEMNEVSY